MSRPFVVVSGLPGSSKTTLGRELAVALSLPLLDKDDILEALFESGDTGDADWRRGLSRESDAILQSEAERSNGAVLISHWHLPGMAPDSGTPTGWIAALPGAVVHIHCQCPPEIAAQRFLSRKRHAGHLDATRSREDTVASLHELAGYPPAEIGLRIDVDTSPRPDAAALAQTIRQMFQKAGN